MIVPPVNVNVFIFYSELLTLLFGSINVEKKDNGHWKKISVLANLAKPTSARRYFNLRGLI